MNSLFLDTSNQICIGLLSEVFEWIEFKIIKEKKASKALHGLIQDILTTHRLELDEIKNIFYISGPGSYTGVRVAHGLCEVLQWQSFDVYSCRHFDIPKLKKGLEEVLKIRNYDSANGIPNFAAICLNQIPGDPSSTKGNKARGIFWTKPDGTGKDFFIVAHLTNSLHCRISDSV